MTATTSTDDEAPVVVRRGPRASAGALAVLAGGLLGAASWQRWAGACSWPGDGSGACLARQDHRFDVLAPSLGWEPVGIGAQLGGASVLVLAVVVALLPWAVTGRRPGLVARVVLAGAVLAQVSVGAATLASGLTGEAVRPLVAALSAYLWLLWPPGLLVRFAVPARGLVRAACVLMLLATPLVAALTYAIGPYDARPWWEAVSGLLVVAAGGCLLAASRRAPLTRPALP